MTVVDCIESNGADSKSTTKDGRGVEAKELELCEAVQVDISRLPSEELSDASSSEAFHLFDVSLSELQQQSKPEKKKKLSKSVQKLVDNFSKRVDVAQEKVEEFTRRRGEEFSKSVGLASLAQEEEEEETIRQSSSSTAGAEQRAVDKEQEVDNSVARGNVEQLRKTNGQETQLQQQQEKETARQASANGVVVARHASGVESTNTNTTFAQRIDVAQEKAERFCKTFGDSISKRMQLNERAEILSKLVADSVNLGGGSKTKTTTATRDEQVEEDDEMLSSSFREGEWT